MERLFCCFLVRNPEGRIRLYCKGADIVLFERLHSCNQEVMSITSDHLNVSSLRHLELRCHLASTDSLAAAASSPVGSRFSRCPSASVNIHLCWFPGVCSGWIADTCASLQGPDRGGMGGVV